MKVFKKFAPAMILLMVLSLMLAACGNSGSTSGSGDSDSLPSYSGAKSVALTDEFKKGFTNYEQQTKAGAKIEMFSTGDSAAKVKQFYVDEMKKKGWSEDSNTLGQGQSAQGIEQAGGFMVGFVKGDKGIGIIGFPGAMAGLFSLKDVGEKDMLIMAMSGPKAAFLPSAK